MADELDLLQEQEELLNQLRIQAARQRSCLQGVSLTRCECCGNAIPAGRQQAIPGVRTCTECQRVLEIRKKQYLRCTMSKAITEQGNVMVPGSTGGGKTVFCSQMVQALLSGQHSDGGRKGIEKNDNDSGDRHDKQG